ncbi:MAG: hypothetical protein A2252_07060 [Elusimicrobia bacterium RIFOXYA2_FULL_39_19]|nr:MAG: hypothetical protein A2252_07060 [Elusimicrobia bacterium RIFOXYA2_FULL_39_19]
MFKIKFSYFTNWQTSFFIVFALIYYLFSLLTITNPAIPYKSIIISLFFLITGIIVFAVGTNNLKKKKLIEDIPTSKIRSLAMGLVELIGKTSEICKIISPISKTECVYYMYTAERKVATKDGYRWEEFRTIKSDLPFYLEDDTGKILVDPRNVCFDYCYRFIDYTNGGNTRYKEWYILNKEEAFLIGTAEKSNDFLQQSKNDFVETIKKLKNNKQELMKYDTNKDGQIDIQEWDCAVDNISNELEQKQMEALSLDPLADVVIKKGSFNDTFIISEKSQKDIISHYTYTGFGYIALGILASLLAVVILSFSTNLNF